MQQHYNNFNLSVSVFECQGKICVYTGIVQP